jgi:hypothetical protein
MAIALAVWRTSAFFSRMEPLPIRPDFFVKPGRQVKPGAALQASKGFHAPDPHQSITESPGAGSMKVVRMTTGAHVSS